MDTLGPRQALIINAGRDPAPGWDPRKLALQIPRSRLKSLSPAPIAWLLAAIQPRGSVYSMIGEIPAAQQLPGMSIHELHCPWMQHPFMHNQFLLGHKADIHKIREAGITRISIDTAKGSDIPEPVETPATRRSAAMLVGDDAVTG